MGRGKTPVLKRGMSINVGKWRTVESGEPPFQSSGPNEDRSAAEPAQANATHKSLLVEFSDYMLLIEARRAG